MEVPCGLVRYDLTNVQTYSSLVRYLPVLLFKHEELGEKGRLLYEKGAFSLGTPLDIHRSYLPVKVRIIRERKGSFRVVKNGGIVCKVHAL